MSETIDDHEILKRTQVAATAAGDAVLARFNPETRPFDRNDIGCRIAANDAISMEILRPILKAALPCSKVVEDELAVGKLGAGAYWVVDPVEGAINQIHGLPDWGVSVTLIRDDALILTAVYLPCFRDTYTALAGHGAWLNGTPLRVSAKSDLSGAMVGTGQAAPGESAAVRAFIGASVTAMLNTALTVRVSVPATLQLVQVASGQMDGFWQNSGVLTGLASGALLVSEAGGNVTDFSGAKWGLHSPNFLATPPQFTQKIASVLSGLKTS